MAPTAEAAEIKSLLDQIDAVKADNEKLQAEIDSASSTAAASSGDQFNELGTNCSPDAGQMNRFSCPLPAGAEGHCSGACS